MELPPRCPPPPPLRGPSGLIHSRAGLQQRQLGQLDLERDKTSHQEEDHTLEQPPRCLSPPPPPPLQGLTGFIHSRSGLQQSRLGQLDVERDKTSHQEDHTMEMPPQCPSPSPPSPLQGLSGLIHSRAGLQQSMDLRTGSETRHPTKRTTLWSCLFAVRLLLLPSGGMSGLIHSRAELRQSQLGQLDWEREKTSHQEDHTLELPLRCPSPSPSPPPLALQGLNGLIHIQAGLQQSRLGQLDWERDIPPRRGPHSGAASSMSLSFSSSSPPGSDRFNTQPGRAAAKRGPPDWERDKTPHQEDHTLELPPRCPSPSPPPPL